MTVVVTKQVPEDDPNQPSSTTSSEDEGPYRKVPGTPNASDHSDQAPQEYDGVLVSSTSPPPQTLPHTPMQSGFPSSLDVLSTVWKGFADSNISTDLELDSVLFLKPKDVAEITDRCEWVCFY